MTIRESVYAFVATLMVAGLLANSVLAPVHPESLHGIPPIDPWYVVAISKWGSGVGWVIPGKCYSPGHSFLLRPDVSPEKILVRAPVSGVIVSIGQYLLGGSNMSIAAGKGACRLRVDLVGVDPFSNKTVGDTVEEGEAIGTVSADALFPGVYIARDCGNGWTWTPPSQILPDMLSAYAELATAWEPIRNPYMSGVGPCGGPGYLLGSPKGDQWVFLRGSPDSGFMVPLAGNLYVRVKPAPYAHPGDTVVDWGQARRLIWFNYILAGGLEGYMPSQVMAQIHTLPWTRVIGATWTPGSIYKIDAPNTMEAEWVYRHRSNVTLNPEGPYPLCQGAGCLDFYLDYGSPGIAEAKAGFAVNNLTGAGYKGVMLDCYDKSWAEKPGGEEILSRYEEKHGIDWSHGAAILYYAVKEKAGDEMVVMARSLAGAEQIPEGPGIRVFVLDKDDCNITLDTLKELIGNTGSNVTVYLESQDKCDSTGLRRLYAIASLAGAYLYTGLPADEVESRLYFYYIGEPLGDIIEVGDSGVLVRLYEYGLVIVGHPNATVLLTNQQVASGIFYNAVTGDIIEDSGDGLTVSLDGDGLAYLVQLHVMQGRSGNSSQGNLSAGDIRVGGSGGVGDRRQELNLEMIIMLSSVVIVLLAYLIYRFKKRISI